MTLKIKYDLEKDAWNLWSAINDKSLNMDFSQFINPGIVKALKNKPKKQGIEIAKTKLSIPNQPAIEEHILIVSSAWNRIEEKYFQRLEKITKKPIYTKLFNVNLTTVPRCPYHKQENWFMIPFSKSTSHCLKIAGHEIFHLQFLHYYEKNLRTELNKSEFNDLKESLTVLLNHSFKDLWSVEDKGYPKHQRLRNLISRKWTENNDFNSLLQKSVRYIKRNESYLI